MGSIKSRAFVTAIACIMVPAACEERLNTEQQLTAILSIAHSPSPVPWSAGPGTTTACATAANVWKFNAVFIETGGAQVTLTSVTNVVDGTAQTEVPLVLTIRANGSATLPREFCFSTSTQHTVQSTFRGASTILRAVNVAAAPVTLSAR
jgi:hypothetical protein